MSMQIIDAAAAQVVPAGRLVAHNFKKFIEHASDDVIAENLKTQGRIFSHGFAPTSSEFVAATLKIGDFIKRHENAQKQQQQATAEAESPSHNLVERAVAEAVAAPFYAIKALLGLGAASAGAAAGAIKRSATARADEKSAALATKIKSASELPAASGEKAVGEVESGISRAARDVQMSMNAEAKEIVVKAKAGELSRQQVIDAVHARTAANDALIEEAEKLAAAGENSEISKTMAKLAENLREMIDRFISFIDNALHAVFNAGRRSGP